MSATASVYPVPAKENGDDRTSASAKKRRIAEAIGDEVMATWDDRRIARWLRVSQSDVRDVRLEISPPARDAADDPPGSGQADGAPARWRMIQSPPPTVLVTQAMAIRHRDLPDVPGERNVQPARLAARIAAIRDRTMRTVVWGTCFVRETGIKYRTNGKHTSTALAMFPMPTGVSATMEDFECETLRDMAALYATYDRKDEIRTQADINKQHAATAEGLDGMETPLISLCVSGFAYAIHGDDSTSLPPEARSSLIYGREDAIRFVAGVMGSLGSKSKSRHLKRAPVVAAMYATWMKSPEEAKAFWSAVRDETGASPDNPDRRLAKWLSETTVVGGGRSVGKGTSNCASRKEFYSRCVYAWNGWRRGVDSLVLKYYPDAPMPEPV